MALSVFNIKHMYWEDDNTTSVDYYELVADTMSDVPHDMYYFSTDTDKYKMAQGSMVYVVSDGTVYMCDSTGAWIEQESGGGGAATLIEKVISANGVYNASSDNADGYSKVTVDVANSYTQADEGKVVSNGALVAQTTHAEITENGIYDITTNNSVSVNVSATSDNNAKFVKGSGTFYVKSCLQKITLPTGVTSLSSDCFSDCSRLVEIILSDELNEIVMNCFKDCVLLSNINLKNVTSIGSRAFENCQSLTSIDIPNTITYISTLAFEKCTNLTTITVHKPEGSISGAPWGATNATVIWDG